MEKIRNTRLLTYDIRVRKVVSNKVRWMGYRDVECLGVVVYNLLSCIRKDNTLVYSRNTGTTNHSRKGITPRRVIKAIDFLECSGMVVNTKAPQQPNKELRTVSWIKATQLFLDEWTEKEVYLQAELDYLDQCEVIELRDTNKNTVPYRNSEHINRMAETVRQLNRLNEEVVVKDRDGSVMTNIYCRIFNETFEYGGRFYRADVLGIKNKDDNARLDITMNGKGVVEVDFSNLHFRIAAALEDLDSEQIPIDVYSEILEDSNNKVERSIIKLAVNIMFNCKNEDKGRRSIQGEINGLTKEDKTNYSLGNAKSVMALIYSEYPEFKYLFCNENSFGRILQNADSHLASDILVKMIESNTPCLPVHDSFIVAFEDMNYLCDVMGSCFRERFGVDYIVPISIKWKDNGVTHEEKIAV